LIDNITILLYHLNMRNIKKLTNWNKYEKKLLANKDFQKSASRLEPEYQLVKSLIEIRLKKKLSQKDLAEKIGTKQPVISRLENMNSKPTLTLLEKISKALNVRLHICFQP